MITQLLGGGKEGERENIPRAERKFCRMFSRLYYIYRMRCFNKCFVGRKEKRKDLVIIFGEGGKRTVWKVCIYVYLDKMRKM